jgi:hypothetical protein
MPRPTLSIDGTAVRDRPVRIAVLLVQRDKAEAAVKVAGPVRTCGANGRLTAALQILRRCRLLVCRGTRGEG